MPSSTQYNASADNPIINIDNAITFAIFPNVAIWQNIEFKPLNNANKQENMKYGTVNTTSIHTIKKIPYDLSAYSFCGLLVYFSSLIKLEKSNSKIGRTDL